MHRTQYSSIVEILIPSGWAPALYADAILGVGQQRLLGSMFGVDGHAGFDPLFAHRGLPPDVSGQYRHADAFELADYGTARILDSSWASWDELAAIDWDRVARGVDHYVHCYEDTESGLVLRGLSPGEWDRLPASARVVPTEARVGNHVYRSVRNVMRDLLPNSGYQVLFDAMGALARHQGGAGVRWVVTWYDDVD